MRWLAEHLAGGCCEQAANASPAGTGAGGSALFEKKINQTVKMCIMPGLMVPSMKEEVHKQC
jgi:hypothetical protein